jgi:hypothetical protein
MRESSTLTLYLITGKASSPSNVEAGEEEKGNDAEGEQQQNQTGNRALSGQGRRFDVR